MFPAQVIREYLVVATRPVIANGLGMLLGDALENVREFRKTIRLLPEERPVLPAFLRLLAHTLFGSADPRPPSFIRYGRSCR